MFKYEVTWYYGTKEIIIGTSIFNALTVAGYGAWGIAALDSYSCIGEA